LKLFRN